TERSRPRPAGDWNHRILPVILKSVILNDVKDLRFRRSFRVAGTPRPKDGMRRAAPSEHDGDPAGGNSRSRESGAILYQDFGLIRGGDGDGNTDRCGDTRSGLHPV